VSNRKKHPIPFTQLPHWIWKEQIKTSAKLMLFAIYRWTAGFGRCTYKISDSTITKMTGIKAPAPIRNYLIERKYFTYEHEDGMTGIYTIPLPNQIRYSPKLNSGDPQIKLNGYQRAKDNIKDKLKESTLTDDLLVEMKSKYPEKDIDQAQKSFLIYPHHQGKNWSDVVLTEKFEKWCAAEKPSHKKFISQFKLDSCGFPMGWCQKCNVSASYEENQLYGDSVCCNAKILPSKIVPNV